MAEQEAANPRTPPRIQVTEDQEVENVLDRLIDKRRHFFLEFNRHEKDSVEAKHLKQKYKAKSIKIGTCIEENFLKLREMDSLHVLKRCVEDKSLWIEVEPRLKAAADLKYDDRALMDSILKRKEKPWHLVLDARVVGTESHKDMKKFILEACEAGFEESKVHLQRICELCGYRTTLQFIEADFVLGHLETFDDPKPFLITVDEELPVPTALQEGRRLKTKSKKGGRVFKPDLVFGYLDKIYIYDWKFWTTEKGSPKKPYDEECIRKMQEDMKCLKHMHPDKEVIGQLVIFPKFDVDAAVHRVPVGLKSD